MFAARSLFCALALAPFLHAQGSPAPCADRLLAVSPNGGNNLLREVDPLTGVTLSSVQIRDVAGRTVNRATGIARHPLTGQIYVMLVLQNVMGRELAVLNPANGQASALGNTGDNFAAIAFAPDGTLYGVTGDGGNNPETLYTIDLNNASTTLVMALGNGNDGESIVFNPRDGLLYHASGCGAAPPACNQQGAEVFEKIDVNTMTITGVPLSGFDYTETLALTPIGESGNFLMADGLDNLCLISDQGYVTQIAVLDTPTKGMVFVPESNSRAFWRHYGYGCAQQNGAIPWMTGRGCPQPGQAVALELRNAPPTAFGLVLLGFAQIAAPLPSLACQMQILPNAPGAFPFFTDSSGAASFPMTLPATLTPGDFYWQAGILETPTTAVVSNPLHMHLR